MRNRGEMNKIKSVICSSLCSSRKIELYYYDNGQWSTKEKRREQFKI